MDALARCEALPNCPKRICVSFAYGHLIGDELYATQNYEEPAASRCELDGKFRIGADLYKWDPFSDIFQVEVKGIDPGDCDAEFGPFRPSQAGDPTRGGVWDCEYYTRSETEALEYYVRKKDEFHAGTPTTYYHSGWEDPWAGDAGCVRLVYIDKHRTRLVYLDEKGIYAYVY